MEIRQIHLRKGDDILNSLRKYAKSEAISAYIISVVGDLSYAVIQCPTNNQITSFNSIHEVITLQGFISPEKVHLHISISNSSCQVFGGHLEEGTIVSKALDVLVGIIKPIQNNHSDSIKETSDKLVIYALHNCPWSSRTIRMLNSKKIPHKHIYVLDDNDFEELKAKSGSSIFPQIYLDNKYLGGFEQLSQLLDDGGLDFLL